MTQVLRVAAELETQKSTLKELGLDENLRVPLQIRPYLAQGYPLMRIYVWALLFQTVGGMAEGG